jgi:hypothetical protein
LLDHARDLFVGAKQVGAEPFQAERHAIAVALLRGDQHDESRDTGAVADDIDMPARCSQAVAMSGERLEVSVSFDERGMHCNHRALRRRFDARCCGASGDSPE